MLPIVTPDEMAAIDRDAREPVEVLIGRAGSAVAREALRMLDGAYGKRVVVIAGKGNNGNDGRDAADKLRRRGVQVDVLEAGSLDVRAPLPHADLVIDAAYGTGFHGDYQAPDPAGVRVLAVDIPSGVDGLTGEAGDGAVRADVTVTFAALKPGLLLEPGRTLAGDVHVADIGLDCSRAAAHLVEARDVRGWLPHRPGVAHKWQSAVWVIGGSPGMTGALTLATRGALRAGAGYVRRSTPGVVADGPIESVAVPINEDGWAGQVLADLERIRAVIVGPGLASSASTQREVLELVASAPCPVLVDGTGLTALGERWRASAGTDVVLTPHDGEYARLTGRAPGADRLAAARELAAASGAVVLLKGPTTVVAAPDGVALVTIEGDARLATAGTGDVLSGIIGALLAQGVAAHPAAAAGAWLHGRASTLGPSRGFLAGDLPDLLPAVFDDLEH
jgi:NAD(P)H-hydrate epimerase